jgi:hypothetical protein
MARFLTLKVQFLSRSGWGDTVAVNGELLLTLVQLPWIVNVAAKTEELLGSEDGVVGRHEGLALRSDYVWGIHQLSPGRQ